MVVCVEGSKCLPELESPILIDLYCHSIGRREGHRGGFSHREMKFCMKQNIFEIVRKIQPWKKTLNTWLKHFVFSNTIFLRLIVEHHFSQEYQGISMFHFNVPPPSNLCWPFCLIHKLMKSTEGFLLPSVMFSLMFPIPSCLLSVLIAEEPCAGLWC